MTVLYAAVVVILHRPQLESLLLLLLVSEVDGCRHGSLRLLLQLPVAASPPTS